uniref:Renin receptor n=1 Tax=Panagrellus redivivus TaxID=6233 RepID=A0A7E4VVZ1_PANRE
MTTRIVLAVLAILGSVAADSIDFLAVPASVKLPSASASLAASEIVPLNKYLLGLSAGNPLSGLSTDLFSRPKALALVQIDGLSTLAGASPVAEVDLTGAFNAQTLHAVVSEDLGQTERDWVSITGIDVTGTLELNTEKVSTIVKTKLSPLRQEILQIYALADAIKARGARLSATLPDVFVIQLQGFASPLLSSAPASEIEIAKKEVAAALQELASELSTAYGDQAVVEVVLRSAESVAEAASESEATNVRSKRAADDVKNVQYWRKTLQVYKFVSRDYPAMFFLIAAVVFILVVAIVFIVVGLLTMDPGKDSIIYRMTTTRMKKD